MLKNYFLIAFRHLVKNKVYASINILGLAVGMGVCLLILQYIAFELSFDTHHSKAGQIYRLVLTEERSNGLQPSRLSSPHGVGSFAHEQLPEIENFTRIYPQKEGFVLYSESRQEPFQEDGIWFADTGFLEMFDLPLIQGQGSLLEAKNTIVLTEAMAAKYFGKGDVLGQSIHISGGWASGEYLVTGVLGDLPANSHLQFDFLLPLQMLLESPMYREDRGWEERSFFTYFQLQENASELAVQKKLDQILANHQLENQLTHASLQPLKDLHLYGDFPDDFSVQKGNLQHIRYYSIIAGFILLIAWLNYINLATAQAMGRQKEVGIRKTIGAKRSQLVYQFLGESLLLNGVAAGLAILIASLLLPVLNQIMGLSLELSLLESWRFALGFVGVILLGAFLAGIYPALVLTSFRAMGVMKASTFAPKSSINLRRGLITFQLVISLLLISGTYLIHRQMAYMKSMDLGIAMEQVMVVNGPRVVLDQFEDSDQLASKYMAFKSELKANHSISAVSGAGSIPGNGYNWSGELMLVGESNQESMESHAVYVDKGFSEAYDFRFLAGKEFSKEDGEASEVIINEKALQAFGFPTADDALGQQISPGGDYLMTIVGVIENFHWNALRDQHKPIVFMNEDLYNAFFSIKMNLSDLPASLAHVEKTYRSVFPDDPYHYYFLDDHFNHQYKQEVQFRNFFTGFSFLAIFIACMGLLAMVSLSANMRSKEIGVRKVLGASVVSLTGLLSREYLLLVLLANLLAVPVVFYGGELWLSNYAYRMDWGIGLLLLPGLLLMSVALLTVSVKSIRTALQDPVDSLRSE